MAANVKLSVNKKILTIEVDLSIDLGPSRPGKTHVVATTQGFVTVPGFDDISVSLNVIKRI
jgi:hypothetical protein